jgi:hypothetical protein
MINYQLKVCGTEAIKTQECKDACGRTAFMILKRPEFASQFANTLFYTPLTNILTLGIYDFFKAGT